MTYLSTVHMADSQSTFNQAFFVGAKLIENCCLCEQRSGHSNLKPTVTDSSYLGMKGMTKLTNSDCAIRQLNIASINKARPVSSLENRETVTTKEERRSTVFLVDSNSELNRDEIVSTVHMAFCSLTWYPQRLSDFQTTKADGKFDVSWLHEQH